MSDRLLKESDVLKISFQLPYVVNSEFVKAVKALPSADPIGATNIRNAFFEGVRRVIAEASKADRPQEWIPCSEDLIRRSDAINLCEKWRNRTNEHHDKNGWYIADTLLKAIKELPSADRPQEEWHNGFYDFLWNVINPNEMQKYIEIYEAQPIAVDGAQMKGADDEA